MIKDKLASVKLLNQALKMELTGINQYFLHAKILLDKGLETLGNKRRQESIHEMTHAEELIDRILMLGGLPAMQAINPISIGENVVEMFKADLQLELDTIEFLIPAIEQLRDNSDHTTAIMLEGMLKDEEEDADWLQTQLDLISSMGLENYLTKSV